MRRAGTALSFAAVAWVMLAGGAGWRDVALVTGAQALGYLAVFTRRSWGAAADVASAAVVAGMAWFVGDVVVLATLALVLGALRAVPGGPPSKRDSVGRRDGPLLALLFGAAVATGAVVVWLGTAGVLWVVAVLFLASAARQPDPWRPLIPMRLHAALFAAALPAHAAVVLLPMVWARDITRQPGLLGLTAGLFALGLAFSGTRISFLGLGMLTGGTVTLALSGSPAVFALIGVAAFVLGVATASVTPWVGRTTVAAMALGTLAGAWLAPRLDLVWGLGSGALLMLAALLIPVLTFPMWRPLLPDPPVLVPARLPGRMTVMLAYLNGQWSVEVRRGRALLGKRHLLRADEALNMLAALEVPGVRETVEKALALDQAEAVRRAELVRGELSELEAKLADLGEMADVHKTCTKDTHGRE